ncbi:DUF397 domain-containing protein [Streptomyces sp. RKAG293]|nr:DUF397 domain-containing protein [Streptomyces sp. RKAG293]
MPAPDSEAWFKSSHSSQDNGNCVEFADLAGHVAVRDSKDRFGPVLVVTAAARASFMDFAQSGTIDVSLPG